MKQKLRHRKRQQKTSTKAARAPKAQRDKAKSSGGLYFFTPEPLGAGGGKAYDSYMSLVPRDKDWVCFHEGDVMFLTPDYRDHIAQVIQRYPDAGLFTCVTNRSSTLWQRFEKKWSDDSNIVNHRRLAVYLQRKYYYSAEDIPTPVDSFLFVIRKSIWKKVHAGDNGKCLNGTIDIGQEIAKRKYRILLMRGLYVFHACGIGEGAGKFCHP